MKTKYEVSRFGDEITKVNVQRETWHSLWINGRMAPKEGRFFDSFDEAKSHVIALAEQRVAKCERNLTYLRERLERARLLECT